VFRLQGDPPGSANRTGQARLAQMGPSQGVVGGKLGGFFEHLDRYGKVALLAATGLLMIVLVVSTL
jgi:hypothetical protein